MEPETRSGELRSFSAGCVAELMKSLATQSFCEVLLEQVNAWLRVEHCALMRMSAGPSVQLFGARALNAIDSLAARAVVSYVDRYHRLDPIRRAFNAPGAQSAIVLRRERAAELAPSAYRRACYDEPRIIDRVSLAKHDGRGGWVVLDLQRQAASGEFSERDCATLRMAAPLLMAACVRHIELLEHAGADAAAWRLRLAAACPAMTGRELDVAAGLLAGRTLRQSAEALGIAYSSVVTYCGRAYSRLGVANLKELRGRFAAQRPSMPVASGGLYLFAA